MRALICLPTGESKLHKTLPQLQTALKDPDLEMRRNALSMYVRLGDEKAAVSACLSIMRDESESVEVRGWAVWMLGRFKTEAKAVVPELFRLLHHREAKLRKDAALVLGRIGGNIPGRIPALLGAIEDHDANVRRVAVKAIGNLKEDPLHCVPALLYALEYEKEEDVRNLLIDALRRFQ